jgi:hypothetical protein
LEGKAITWCLFIVIAYLLTRDIRWFNHVDPDLKRDPWSAKEDRVCREAHVVLGNR